MSIPFCPDSRGGGDLRSSEEGTHGAEALERTGDRPLWAQLQDDLLRRIRAHEFDASFPGELALTEEYEVSRHAVRRALGQLRADGVVVAERGRSPRLPRGGPPPATEGRRSTRCTACSRRWRSRAARRRAPSAGSTGWPTASSRPHTRATPCPGACGQPRRARHRHDLVRRRRADRHLRGHGAPGVGPASPGQDRRGGSGSSCRTTPDAGARAPASAGAARGGPRWPSRVPPPAAGPPRSPRLRPCRRSGPARRPAGRARRASGQRAHPPWRPPALGRPPGVARRPPPGRSTPRTSLPSQ